MRATRVARKLSINDNYHEEEKDDDDLGDNSCFLIAQQLPLCSGEASSCNVTSAPNLDCRSQRGKQTTANLRSNKCNSNCNLEIHRSIDRSIAINLARCLSVDVFFNSFHELLFLQFDGIFAPARRSRAPNINKSATRGPKNFANDNKVRRLPDSNHVRSGVCTKNSNRGAWIELEIKSAISWNKNIDMARS